MYYKRTLQIKPKMGTYCQIMRAALANCPSDWKEMTQYPVHQLSFCHCNMSPMPAHEESCPRFTTLQHVLSECRRLHFTSLPHSGSDK